jgi:hypothetical protein
MQDSARQDKLFLYIVGVTWGPVSFVSRFIVLFNFSTRVFIIGYDTANLAAEGWLDVFFSVLVGFRWYMSHDRI